MDHQSSGEPETNAREEELRAEEKWLIEILQKIRQRCNDLKMQALYYEGLKADLFRKHAADFGKARSVQDELEFIPKPDSIPDNNVVEGQDEQSADYIPEQMFAVHKQQVDPGYFHLMEDRCNDLQLQNLNMALESGDDQFEEDAENEEDFDENLSIVHDGF